jgi:hypothetical protein
MTSGLESHGSISPLAPWKSLAIFPPIHRCLNSAKVATLTPCQPSVKFAFILAHLHACNMLSQITLLLP